MLLVDDQPLQRMGMRMILESQEDMTVVGEASDGDSAVRQAGALRPDVVLMDVQMPGMDGIEATKRIIERHPAVQIIVLTMFDLDEYAYPVLRAGASGFLLKDARPEEILDGIRVVGNGDAIVAPTLTRRLLDAVSGHLPGREAEPRPNEAQGALEALTAREREVLVEIARGLSNSEIAERLAMAEATVKTHVGRILGKLELRDRVQAVIFAYDARLVEPSEG
ncbi:response regulator [Nocardiopsis sp. CNT-189]|uniref:response regulator n=1 Tax=Nocardiopsis oceanisediminis TaxID=2816862 RepID=UPI003B3B513D